MTSEGGWLIEAGWSEVSCPEYFWGVSNAPVHGYSLWTSNHALAVRFSRKQDGEQVAHWISHFTKQPMRVCYHEWG